MSNFKTKNTFEKRKYESNRIGIKYKDRIPIIVEVSKQDSKTLTLDKEKYLVPFDLTVGQFMFVIRKRLKLESDKALFVFFNDTLQPASASFGSIYKEYKDADGFLYSIISLESVFG
jgi:GABA(A) receptor-associated protein